MSTVIGHGTAEIRPLANTLWYRWRVWYFPYGKTETTLYSDHRSRHKAEQRAERYANAPHTSHGRE